MDVLTLPNNLAAFVFQDSAIGVDRFNLIGFEALSPLCSCYQSFHESTMRLLRYHVNRQSHIFLRERLDWTQVQQNKRKIVCGRGARGKRIVLTLPILDARYRATRRPQVRYTEAMEREWMTVKQTAELLQVNPATIYKLIREGRIRPYNYAGTQRIRIKRSDLFTPRPIDGVRNWRTKER